MARSPGMTARAIRCSAIRPGATRMRREAWPSRGDLAKLGTLDAREAVRLYGDGEILRVVESPRNGARRLAGADSGEPAEHYERYPAHYLLKSNGRGAERL